MKKIYWITAFCFLLIMLGNYSAEAQRYKKNKNTEEQTTQSEEPELTDSSAWRRFAKKLTFGGNFGAQFGTYTFVDVSPMVGYRATEKLTVGIGGTYNYLGYRPTNENYSIYGGRLFTQYAFYKNLFVHGEYEALNVPDWRRSPPEEVRAWITAPLIGGGYRSLLGKRSYFTITALYNLNYVKNQDVFPMYASPLVLRIGFSL